MIQARLLILIVWCLLVSFTAAHQLLLRDRDGLQVEVLDNDYYYDRGDDAIGRRVHIPPFLAESKDWSIRHQLTKYPGIDGQLSGSEDDESQYQMLKSLGKKSTIIFIGFLYQIFVENRIATGFTLYNVIFYLLQGAYWKYIK